MQAVSGLLVLIQQKMITGLGLSQNLRVMQGRNGKVHLPWGYRTSLTKDLEELSCPGRNRTGRTWKSQSANVAKAAMLHGKVKQKWFFVSSMIRVAIDDLSSSVCNICSLNVTRLCRLLTCMLPA